MADQGGPLSAESGWLSKAPSWFFSTAGKSGTGPTCSVSEALTSITTSELEDTTAPALMSSPAHSVSTPTPVPLASVIPAAGIPVGQPFFALTLGLKCKEWDYSPGSPPEGQSGKRAHADTKEGSVSSGCSSPPIQLVASHSSKQLEPELINLTFSPVKAATDPNDSLAVEALGSTIDHDKGSGGGQQGWCWPKLQWVRFKQWLAGKCCWIWSLVSNWGLPHLFRYQWGSHQLCL